MNGPNHVTEPFIVDLAGLEFDKWENLGALLEYDLVVKWRVTSFVSNDSVGAWVNVRGGYRSPPQDLFLSFYDG